MDSVKNQNRMANSVDPDETAHYEPSHQDIHSLQTIDLVSTAKRREANTFGRFFAIRVQLLMVNTARKT